MSDAEIRALARDAETTFRCLSVRQPYAEQIASGVKIHEYRTWGTRYRGALLICAGVALHADAGPDDRKLPRGVAVCLVDLVDVLAGDGEYAWVIERPRRLPPVPVRGKLSLFRLPTGSGLEEVARVVQKGQQVQDRQG